MKKIPIGNTGDRDFGLPLDLVTQTIAILAKKGAGKSYTASVMVEGLLDAGQVPVIVDPTGAWWGLKSSADGKQPGYPMVVFGGEHGDLPLEEGAGEATARAIVEQRFPAIIDLSLFRKGQLKRFITPFLETIYRLNREPLMLVVDEADDICPQRPFGDEAQMVGALEDVVKRGRKKGIGCTLITQRPADLAKQVLTQCEMLVAMRVSHPLDLKAVMEWVNVHADKTLAAAMVDSLPGLPVGTAWFWSPGWGDVFERVNVNRRRTFDSGATPKAGETITVPKRMAQPDLVKIGGEIMASVQRAKDNDPRELKAKITQLERELRMAAERQAEPMVEVRPPVEVPILTPRDQARFEQLIELMKQWKETMGGVDRLLFQLHDELMGRLKELQRQAYHPARPMTAAPRLPATPRPVNRIDDMIIASVVGSEGLSKCATAMLTVTVQFGKPVSRSKVALVSGYSINSSTFRNGLSELRVKRYVEEGEMMIATPAGHAAVGDKFQPFPTGDAAIEHWLGSGKMTKCGSTMLRTIHEAGGKLARDILSDLSGYSLESSTFRNGLSELRTLGLIESNSSQVWIHPEFQ